MATKSEKRAKRKLLIAIGVIAVIIIGIVIWGISYSNNYQKQGEKDYYEVDGVSVASVRILLDKDVVTEKVQIMQNGEDFEGYYKYKAEDLTADEAAEYLNKLVSDEGFSEAKTENASVAVKEFPDLQKTAMILIGTDADGSNTVIVRITPLLSSEEKAAALSSDQATGSESSQIESSVPEQKLIEGE